MVIRYVHVAIELWGAAFCLIASACVYITRRFDEIAAKNLILLLVIDAVLNFNEAMAYYYRGSTTEAGYIIVRVANFTVFACGYLLAVTACWYFARITELQGAKKNMKWRGAVYSVCAVGLALLVLSRIFGFYYAFDDQNRYYRLTDTYWLMNLLGILPILILYYRILANRRYFKPLQFAACLTFIFLPVAGIIFQTFNYGVSVYNIANTICIIFFFITYEIEYAEFMSRHDKETLQERVRLLEKQAELDEERIHLYHSQIRPHFIFNSLSAVRSYLVPGSDADEALSHFTGFLRGSIDLMTRNDCIRAEREFALVGDYLYMQKERFGDDINVVLELEDKDFMLPAFSVQTLVENSIWHGIRDSEEGCGNVAVRSYRTDSEHIVEVIDDGTGFDTSLIDKNKKGSEKSAEEGDTHIGIRNLRKRLDKMCGGTLEIESMIGEGTRARLRIPAQSCAAQGEGSKEIYK